MLIPVGFAQAKYRMRLTGDNEEMIFTMGHDDGGNPATNLANLLFDAIRDTFIPAGGIYSGYTFVGVDVQVGTTSSGAAPYINGSSTDAPVVGTAVGSLLPSNCAVLVEKRTAAAGRRGQGRMYVPGIAAEPNVDGLGVLASAYVTGLTTALAAWLTRLGSDGLPPYLLHATAPATPDPITALAVDPVIGTQRRRMRR